MLLSQPIFLPATYSQESLAVNFDNTETEQQCHVLYFIYVFYIERTDRTTDNEAELEIFYFFLPMNYLYRANQLE